MLVVVVQIELRQSLLTVQLPPAAHLGHEGPPQSTPVSLPFLMPSEHVAARAGSSGKASHNAIKQKRLLTKRHNTAVTMLKIWLAKTSLLSVCYCCRLAEQKIHWQLMKWLLPHKQ
jgi:hypothetical protein